MARAYTVAAVAVTLRVSYKWLDNVLSHHRIQGVVQSRQGVSRRLTPQAIVKLELAVRISRSVGSTIGRALALAAQLMETGSGTSTLELPGSVRLSVDLDAITQSVYSRMAEAVEVTPVRRRGRPPFQR
ncbi:MAG: hypothetical protein ABIW94_06905 [Gemmatimonadaceae bacterium]